MQLLQLTAPGGQPIYIEPTAIEALTPAEGNDPIYAPKANCVVYGTSGQSYRVRESVLDVVGQLARWDGAQG
jgi:hypothetical protein